MTFHANTRQTILLHCKKWLLQHLRPCFLKIPKYKLLVDMTTFLFDILLTLQIFTSWCEMRKTIKSVKYPFSRDWNPFAHHTFHVGDKKEATACWKYRTFSYNEGFGSTFMITSFFRSRESPKDHCENNFAWGLSIGWKTGMEADKKQVCVADLFFSHDNQTRTEETLQQAKKIRWHFNLYGDWQDLFEWQSVCYAISVVKKSELIYVNGKFIMVYEWPKEFSKGWGS